MKFLSEQLISERTLKKFSEKEKPQMNWQCNRWMPRLGYEGEAFHMHSALLSRERNLIKF